VNGDRHAVELAGECATSAAAGEHEGAVLTPATESPVRILRIGTRVVRVTVAARGGRGRYTLDVDGRRFEVEALDERAAAIRELAALGAPPAGPAPLLAPMPGLVVRVSVAPGDAVAAGQGLLVMEAMKMENELRAATAGTVRTVRVQPGTAVEKGAVLVELD